ncbi:hypothetical protein Tco_0670213 [Tanacetum coccineum]
MAVRQSYLVDTDIESGPLVDFREIEIPQPLPSAPLLVSPSDDPYLIVRQAYTPATIDTEFEPEDAPLETEEFEAFEPSDTRTTSPHSTAPLDSTTPLSPGHPLAHTSSAPTRVSYYRSTARMVRYRSSYETPSPLSSPTLPIRKRYRDTSELVEDIEDESSDSDTEREGSEDEGPGSEDEGPSSEDEGPGSKEEEEEAAPEGQEQIVPVVDTATDEPLGLGYRALRRRELALGEGSVPSTFEIGQSSRSMSEQ